MVATRCHFNYLLSVKILKGLLQRLRHKSDILKEYDRTIREHLSKGIIEPVSLAEKTANEVYYLPHHGVGIVCRDKATTKLRVVGPIPEWVSVQGSQIPPDNSHLILMLQISSS